MIEDYLRSSQSHVKPLGETDGLSEAAQQVGGTGDGLFGYENQREMMRSLFTALKANPDSSALSNGMLMRFWSGGLGRLAGFLAPAGFRPGGEIFLFHRVQREHDGGRPDIPIFLTPPATVEAVNLLVTVSRFENRMD